MTSLSSSGTPSTPGEGRNDGRSAADLRPFAINWDPMGFAISSLIVRTGRTAVLCSVCHQEGVPRWRKGQGKGWLSAEYRLLRVPPRAPKPGTPQALGRTQEIQRLIGRSLRACIDMEALGENTLLIDCDVIQADAGTRTASITGAWVALKHACDQLLAQGLVTRQPITKQVAAVSVGLVNSAPLLDLDYSEDSRADVDLNVVMDEHRHLLESRARPREQPSAVANSMACWIWRNPACSS